MKVIFVTGTDTGVGKSVVTGLLAQYLLEKKYCVATQKWVETGCSGNPTDINTHLKFMERKRKDFRGYFSLMAPYVFKFASSPHLASLLENKRINIIKIKRSLTTLSKHFDFVIVEGIGGLLVPLNDRQLLIDVVKELDLPILIVAGNKLGAINHTLLSIEALKSRGIKITGIIFNNISKKENRLILKDNPAITKKFSGERVLGTLPYSKDIFKLKKRFESIGEKIIVRARPKYSSRHCSKNILAESRTALLSL